MAIFPYRNTRGELVTVPLDGHTSRVVDVDLFDDELDGRGMSAREREIHRDEMSQYATPRERK